MSFKAELIIDNQSYAVLNFYMSLLRNTNAKGQPSSNPSWSIDLTIEAVNDTTITQWMVDPGKQVDGTLTIYKADEPGKLKDIEFKKTYCFGMIDRFIPDLSVATCSMRISGEEIHIGTSILVLEQ
jgi:hypothetical protein